MTQQTCARCGKALCGWQPIATAPDLERIWVCGWQKQNGNTIGYWWWHEDVAENGRAFDHPTATHWCAIALPAFPSPTPEAERAVAAA